MVSGRKAHAGVGVDCTAHSCVPLRSSEFCCPHFLPFLFSGLQSLFGIFLKNCMYAASRIAMWAWLVVLEHAATKASAIAKFSSSWVHLFPFCKSKGLLTVLEESLVLIALLYKGYYSEKAMLWYKSYFLGGTSSVPVRCYGTAKLLYKNTWIAR
jgi:hypothetical protein